MFLGADYYTTGGRQIVRPCIVNRSRGIHSQLGLRKAGLAVRATALVLHAMNHFDFVVGTQQVFGSTDVDVIRPRQG
ncbi:hypothetical protein D3C75_1009740 [compost metagenome]